MDNQANVGNCEALNQTTPTIASARKNDAEIEAFELKMMQILSNCENFPEMGGKVIEKEVNPRLLAGKRTKIKRF